MLGTVRGTIDTGIYRQLRGSKYWRRSRRRVCLGSPSFVRGVSSRYVLCCIPATTVETDGRWRRRKSASRPAPRRPTCVCRRVESAVMTWCRSPVPTKMGGSGAPSRPPVGANRPTSGSIASPCLCALHNAAPAPAPPPPPPRGMSCHILHIALSATIWGAAVKLNFPPLPPSPPETRPS